MVTRPSASSKSSKEKGYIKEDQVVLLLRCTYYLCLAPFHLNLLFQDDFLFFLLNCSCKLHCLKTITVRKKRRKKEQVLLDLEIYFVQQFCTQCTVHNAVVQTTQEKFIQFGDQKTKKSTMKKCFRCFVYNLHHYNIRGCIHDTRTLLQSHGR